MAIQDRLPTEVATHFDASGVANGFTDRAVLPWLVGGLTVAVGSPLMAIALIPQTSIMMPRIANGLPLALVAFLTTIFLLITLGQMDGGTANAQSFQILPIGIVVAVGCGAIAAAIGGPTPAPPTTDAPAPPGANRFPVADGETAVWAGRTPMSRAIVVGLVVAAAINVTVVVATGARWALLFVVVISLVVLAASSFSVTAGPTGVRAVGLLGLPRIHVPLSQITSAEVGSINAVQFGGWGLRINRKGESAVLTRSGPTLVINRTDKVRLHITIDEPEKPAAVIAALLDRRASETRA